MGCLVMWKKFANLIVAEETSIPSIFLFYLIFVVVVLLQWL